MADRICAPSALSALYDPFLHHSSARAAQGASPQGVGHKRTKCHEHSAKQWPAWSLALAVFMALMMWKEVGL